MKYELNPDAVLVTVLEESMLVAVAGNKTGIDSMYSVNKTGVYYWELLEKGLDTEDIIARAMLDYGISEERARPSFLRFFFDLRDSGFLTTEE